MVKLQVWGYDEDGFWKHTHTVYRNEIADILATYDNYEDYDVF